MEVKPIVPLIRSARLIWPENGIQVAAGIGPSGAVSMAMSILERYLGRGEYELDPAFLVFAQWANEQKEDVLRENGALLMFCRELIREKNQAAEYLRKPEVSSRLWNLLGENFLAMEQKVRLAWQVQNYVQRFSEIKRESVQALKEVLTERRFVLELFEQFTPEEHKELKRLLPEYFPEGSNPKHVLTTMSRQRWSRLKERLQELTAVDFIQVNPVSGEENLIRLLEYPEMKQVLQREHPELLLNRFELMQKVYEAAGQTEQVETKQLKTKQVQTKQVFSEKESGEKRFREIYVTRKEEYIRKIWKQADNLPEEMEAMIGKSPLISLIGENQETAAFLTECLYEIPELQIYRTGMEDLEAAGDRETCLTEIIKSLDSKEWKLLESRILYKTTEKTETAFQPVPAQITAAEYVFLKTIREHIEEYSVFSTITNQRRTEQRETQEREMKTVQLREAAFQMEMSLLQSELGHGAETARTVITETVRNRAVMADSAITLKTGSIRELLKEQTRTELCSYEFVMPDRVVVRPVSHRGTEPPETAGQGTAGQGFSIPEISPEGSSSLQTDILKIQRPEQQRLKGEYEQKLKELSDRLNEQKEELERLQEIQYQLRDSRQTKRLLNRMIKQLKGQLQLERMQRGAD